MFKKLLAVSLLSFALVGCGGDDGPKIDFTTLETYTSSVQAATEKLSDTDKAAFARALVNVTAKAATNPANNRNDAKIAEELKNKLNGKTAKEIISEYDK